MLHSAGQAGRKLLPYLLRVKAGSFTPAVLCRVMPTFGAHRPATLVFAHHPSGSIPVSAQGNFMRPRMGVLGEKSKAGTLALGVMRADSGMPALESPKAPYAELVVVR